jgi:Flp pilus assembly protein TadD
MALLARGEAYLVQGQASPAIADLKRAVELAPNNANAHLLLAKALDTRGERAQARGQYCKAAELGHQRAIPLCRRK